MVGYGRLGSGDFCAIRRLFRTPISGGRLEGGGGSSIRVVAVLRRVGDAASLSMKSSLGPGAASMK